MHTHCSDLFTSLHCFPHGSLPCLSAWLTGYEHPVVDKINQRIEDLTGLEMDTAEELQVCMLVDVCVYAEWVGET